MTQQLPSNPDDFLAYFNEWTERLRLSLEASLFPRITLDETSMEAIMTASRSLPDPSSYIGWSEADDTVLPILRSENIEGLTSESFDDVDLITYSVLRQATPHALADWCRRTAESDTAQLMAFLHNVALMRQCLASGGARKGRYGEAVTLYHQLLFKISNDTDSAAQVVQRRLALAIALELAEPYPLFNELPGASIDPITRYDHYVKAYLDGDLDPAFGYLTVWELRHVVNADATDEELSWGRACLQAYRPDLALEATNGSLWTYNFLVRTDVAYTKPDWYKQPRSYDQILSGGGKCGPRAWYGRFMCKAFGIPTWGVRQPGHAAMMRWTTNDSSSGVGCSSVWQSCLGGGIHTSWWGDDRRCGLDFLLEAQARTASCGTQHQCWRRNRPDHMTRDQTYCAGAAATGGEDEGDWYTRCVLSLEWVAALRNESDAVIRQTCRPDPEHSWFALALFQRRLLVQEGSKAPMLPRPPPCHTNQIWNLSHAVTQIDEPAMMYDSSTGTVTIPAVGFDQSTTTINKILVMPSFRGGRQVFVKDDAVLEYTLDIDNLLAAWTTHNKNDDEDSGHHQYQYLLTFGVATAHRSEQPVSVTVDGINISVPLPYTMGLWGETEPMPLTWHDTHKVLHIRVSRPHQPFGFALKSVRLVRVRADLGNRSTVRVNEVNDAHATLTDLFADPDPYETFCYQWTIPTLCCVDTVGPAATTAAITTIQLSVTGHKAENGQTLHSTGLTVWRASGILADWLVERQRQRRSTSTIETAGSSEEENKELVSPASVAVAVSSSSIPTIPPWHETTVLELGAGLGIPGMVCHKLGAAVVLLTDGDTDTLTNLRENVRQNCREDTSDTTTTTTNGMSPMEAAVSCPSQPQCETNSPTRSSTGSITCQQLVWGNHEHIDLVRTSLRAAHAQTTSDTIGTNDDEGVLDVILGSDIIYVEHVVQPLFYTVHQLLRRDTGLFILAFCRRNVSITWVLQRAIDEGLVLCHAPESQTDDGIYIFVVPSAA